MCSSLFRPVFRLVMIGVNTATARMNPFSSPVCPDRGVKKNVVSHRVQTSAQVAVQGVVIGSNASRIHDGIHGISSESDDQIQEHALHTAPFTKRGTSSYVRGSCTRAYVIGIGSHTVPPNCLEKNLPRLPERKVEFEYRRSQTHSGHTPRVPIREQF